MKPVVIIAAMPVETALLECTLANAGVTSSNGLKVVEGKLGGLRVVLSAAGVGKVNAAAATAALIERHRPKLVINTGCAGAYLGSGLAVGDLVVASEEVLADEGVLESDGWKDLGYMKLPSLELGGVSHYNSIPLSRDAAERAVHLADYYGVFLMRGRFATVSTCSGTSARGAELAARWSVIAENMEGGAVAQVCLRYGVECLEIRGISNLVAERNLQRWNLPRAVEAAQRFVIKYLKEIDNENIRRPGSLS